MGFEPSTISLSEGGSNAPYRWAMTAPLTWTGEFRGRTGRLVVDASDANPFTTDLASVPRWLTWLFPRYGKYTKAAVLHDYLCKNFRRATVAVMEPDPEMLELRDRSDADEVFRMVMKELDVPWARRWLMWSAVNWATLWTSLFPGRGSKPVLRWVGRLVLAAGAAAAVALVWTGVFGSLVDAGAWRWLRILAFAVGAFSAASAVVLLAGFVALGRADRASENGWCLGMTVASIPLIAAGLAIAVLLVAYLFVEDLFQGFKGFKAWRRRRRSEAAEMSPRAQRLAAVKAS